MNKKNVFLIALGTGVLAVLRFFPFILGKTFFFGDNFSLFVPGKLFTATWLREGILPLWNPFVLGGIPWVANINESVFYPSTLLFMFFHPAVALNLNIMVHVIITGCGMYCLCRFWTGRTFFGLIGAILWMFSVQIGATLNNLSTLQSLAWMPWVVFVSIATKGLQRIVFLTALLSLQILGGYPQYIVFTLMGAWLLTLWQERANFSFPKALLVSSRFLFAGVFAIGLCAFIVLPFINDLRESTRMIQSQSQSQAGALHPAEFIKFALPYFFDNPSAGMRWGPNWNHTPTSFIYITWFGVLAIFSLFFSKKLSKTDLFFFISLLFFILYALGPSIGISNIVSNLIPIFKASRGPALMLPLANFFGVLWVCDALSRLSISIELTKKILIFTAGLLFFSLMLLCLNYISFDFIWEKVDIAVSHRLSMGGFHTLQRDRIIAAQIFCNLSVNAVCLFLSLLFWKNKKNILLLLVLFFEMSFNTSGMFIWAPANIYPSWSEIKKPTNHEILEIVGNDRVLIGNLNEPYSGFAPYWEAIAVRSPFSDSFVGEEELKNFGHAKNLRRGFTPDWNMVYGINSLNGYVSLLPQDIDKEFNKEKEPAINNLSSIQVNDPKLSFWGTKYYLQDSWYPSQLAFTNPPLLAVDRFRLFQINNSNRLQGNSLQILEETPNKIRLLSEAKTDQVVILADRNDEDWMVYVNGKKQKIANYGGRRSVSVAKGKNEIIFIYEPRKFEMGVYISLFSLFSFALLIFVDHKKII